MRVLTVRQPWAWALIHAGKTVENRVRNVAGDYRGPLAIHAGLTVERETVMPLDAIAIADRRPATYPTGAIIGVVDLVGVHVCKSHSGEMDMPVCFDSGTPYAVTCSPWAEFTPGAVTHHLVLANPRPLSEPLPFRGALYLQYPSAEVTAEMMRRIA